MLQARPIYLNYVGYGAYKQDDEFIAESKKYGAQRAVSFTMLKRLVSTEARIYYARFETYQGSNRARVFAYGDVIGFSTTMPLEMLAILDGNAGEWHSVVRGCGSYLIKEIVVSDLTETIEHIEKLYGDKVNAFKWFIRTNIHEYDSVIDIILTYKAREKKIYADEIVFTRAMICLNGLGLSNKYKGTVGIIKQYRHYNNDIEDIHKERIVEGHEVLGLKYMRLDNFM